MAGKDAERVTQTIALIEVGGGQKVEIEAGFADLRRGQRLVQMHGDAEALALRRHLDPVAQRQLGIAGVGDQLVRHAAVLARGVRRHRVPLFGSGLQADLAIGSNALAMLDDLDAAQLLIAEHRMKAVLVGEHAQSLCLEIVQGVQVQLRRSGRTGRQAGGQQQSGPVSDHGWLGGSEAVKGEQQGVPMACNSISSARVPSGSSRLSCHLASRPIFGTLLWPVRRAPFHSSV